MNARASKKVRLGLEQVAAQLKSVTSKLDPILRSESIFDLTDPNTSGRVVALPLVAQTKHPLAKIPEFYGAGLYAIYYKSDFEPYAQLKGSDHPIYVGKADPDNQAAKDAVSQGSKLSARRNEHARSITKAVSTLDINDFECRFLIVQTGFQKSAEEHLISLQADLEFGNKDMFWPGQAWRQLRHPSQQALTVRYDASWREWAAATTENQKSHEVIIEQIGTHLAMHRPYVDIHEIFERFTEDMHQMDSDRIVSTSEQLVAAANRHAEHSEFSRQVIKLNGPAVARH